MAFPKTLRLQLGLSLTEFADLLFTNVGQLSMVESGLRSLPAASLQLAVELEKALANTQTAIPAKNQPDEKIVSSLNKHIRSCELKLDLLQIAALKETEKLEAARRMLLLSEAFATSPFLADVGEVHLRMQILQRIAKKKLQRFEEKLVRLQIAIAGLQGEIQKSQQLKTQ